jgi:hypothetical protein
MYVRQAEEGLSFARTQGMTKKMLSIVFSVGEDV